jgi:hypothetical protein
MSVAEPDRYDTAGLALGLGNLTAWRATNSQLALSLPRQQLWKAWQPAETWQPADAPPFGIELNGSHEIVISTKDISEEDFMAKADALIDPSNRSSGMPRIGMKPMLFVVPKTRCELRPCRDPSRDRKAHGAGTGSKSPRAARFAMLSPRRWEAGDPVPFMENGRGFRWPTADGAQARDGAAEVGAQRNAVVGM